MSKDTTYTTCEANGRAYAEQIAARYRSEGKDVRVEHGSIPQWGRSDANEPGYRIIVSDRKK